MMSVEGTSETPEHGKGVRELPAMVKEEVEQLEARAAALKRFASFVLAVGVFVLLVGSHYFIDAADVIHADKRTIATPTPAPTPALTPVPMSTPQTPLVKP